MLRSLITRFALAGATFGMAASIGCNSERVPEKRGPGEGFAWQRTAASATPSPSEPPPAQSAARPPPATPPPVARSAAAGFIDMARFDKKLVFQDDFERKELGPDWKFTGGDWRVENGAVHSTKALNKCLWLTKAVPDDAVVELQAWSMSPRGDLKFTVFGDGNEHETGYTLILGGWFNSISIIARMDEHGHDRKEKHDKGVVKVGRKYKLEMRRVGGRIDWLVDGAQYLSYDDAAPLRGAGHDRIAFCNWECPLFFDDLRVYSLTPKAGAAKPASASPSAPAPATGMPQAPKPQKLRVRPGMLQKAIQPASPPPPAK